MIQFLIVLGFSATGFATLPPSYPFMRAVFLTPAALALSSVAFYNFFTLYRALFTSLTLNTQLNIELGIATNTAGNNAGNNMEGAGSNAGSENPGAECSA